MRNFKVMSKKFALLLCIFFSMASVFALQSTFSANFSLGIDFSNGFNALTSSISTEFRMNPSAFGRDFDFSASLKNSDLESAKLSLKINNIKMNLYKNVGFITTNDPVVLYKIDGGRDGIDINSAIGKLLLSGEVMYLELPVPAVQNHNLIFGKRSNKFDVAFSGYQKLVGLNLNYELIQQDVLNFETKNSFLFFSVAEGNYNWGVRYILAGAPDSRLVLSPTYVSNQNVVSAWYKFGTSPAFNTYVNTNFDFENTVEDLLNNSEAVIDVSYGGLFVNLKKTGFSDITGMMPTEWGKFMVTFGNTFSLMDFSGKASYSFGKPIHTSVNTIGEIYYVELGRSFGNISTFAKYQKIIGYYEEKDFFYGELKFTGFQNAQVSLQIGNGDFAGDNPFKPVFGININTWW
ncbi:MAG: hypothetical protein ACUVQF_02880 [Fervidobacterium sp.]|uniref:hypothetical protein n=1 Tax=Fervidobacterium sp. TaxID=1871331 RepID=UPI00404AA43E